MADSAANTSTDAPQLKAGHAPATKVGGMRVVQNKPPKEKTAEVKMTDEEKAEFGEDGKEKKGEVIVSGGKVSEESAFPKEAVKSYHEKPVPTHDHKSAQNKPTVIQQPRK